MNNKNKKSQKLLDFFGGKGFYLVLILCVIAIGASGYMLLFGGPGDVSPDSQSLALQGTTPSPSPRPEANNPAAATPSPDPRPSPTPNTPAAPGGRDITPPDRPPQTPPPPAAQDAAEEGPASAEGTAVAVTGPADVPDVPPDEAEEAQDTLGEEVLGPTFILPVSGDFIVGFSDRADVFFEALREWRFHPGIDIAASLETPVMAAADGVVTEVLENGPRNMGITVVLEHSAGYRTVYSNLSENHLPFVGQWLRQGDIVGEVGNSTIAEAAISPHLHFEIHRNGEPIDPVEYFG